MNRFSKFQRIFVILFALAFAAITGCYQPSAVQASSISLVVLSNYNKTIQIHQSFYLAAITSNGKKPSWKSSDSKIASVNTYGMVTGKRGGTCRITAKISGAEASCQVTVKKTTITLSSKTITMENGAQYTLGGKTSNGSSLSWKSSKRSVATIDDEGHIEAKKPGETTITASADGSSATCKVTVKKPKVTLNYTKASLYRGQTLRLTAKVSSNRIPVWKSKKTSVVTVDEKGLVTARKHGTALVQASIDGITRICEIEVKAPKITLSKSSVTMKKGESLQLSADVSSGNSPTWNSSSKKIATVDKNGKVQAKKKGSCYIYASEDGTKKKCRVHVTN
ncbi:MAG: Ig-like domain-containing protein [Lachnospiraceae bacterium]|nr:Ig-like domain-containing protein [Lachnospiraceae bacterium]